MAHISAWKKYERKLKTEKKPLALIRTLGRLTAFFFFFRAQGSTTSVEERLSDPLRVSLLRCQCEIVINMAGLLLNRLQFRGGEGKKVTDPKKEEMLIIPHFLFI